MDQLLSVWTWYWDGRAHIPLPTESGYPLTTGPTQQFFDHLAPLWNPIMANDFVRGIALLIPVFALLQLFEELRIFRSESPRAIPKEPPDKRTAEPTKADDKSSGGDKPPEVGDKPSGGEA